MAAAVISVAGDPLEARQGSRRGHHHRRADRGPRGSPAITRGADVAIGLAVDDKSFAAAYAGLRRGGRLVLVALPAAGTLSIPVFDTVLNGTSVIGSIVGTRADLLDVFALHAAGQTRVIYETRPLAAVNDSIAEVLHGKAKARIVMTP